MTRRTIEVSGEGVGLSLRHKQLMVTQGGELAGQVPIADIGVLIVDTPTASYSHPCLVELLESGAVVVLCGADHHPVAFLTPLAGNYLQAERFRAQVEASVPIGKSLWQHLVRAKVRHQALAIGDEITRAKLAELATKVKSGDPENVEAWAARVYWAAWLGRTSEFRRAREGPPPNNLLNYGYMALRAATARALVATGLHPSLALRHINRFNAFGLADDLMEPFRPAIDVRVRALWRAGVTEIDRDSKRALLTVLTVSCEMDGPEGERVGPMTEALERLAFGVWKCLSGETKSLPIPTTSFEEAATLPEGFAVGDAPKEALAGGSGEEVRSAPADEPPPRPRPQRPAPEPKPPPRTPEQGGPPPFPFESP